MSVLSSVKFCVCVSNRIKDRLTCCAVKYWMHVRCLWHWDVLLLTGLRWQAALLSATDNAAADFGLVFWLQWQQVCWQGEDGVDGSGEKYLTCLEQSRYLIKLVAAGITVYFVEKKKTYCHLYGVWIECVFVLSWRWAGHLFMFTTVTAVYIICTYKFDPVSIKCSVTKLCVKKFHTAKCQKVSSPHLAHLLSAHPANCNHSRLVESGRVKDEGKRRRVNFLWNVPFFSPAKGGVLFTDRRGEHFTLFL